jgi:tRNA(Arg) A34 adenosine deaminase TadA
MQDDEYFMRLAIDASRAARQAGNMPFGAALVRDGALLHVAGNNQITTGDCTGHAEVVLIREAAQKLGSAALAGTSVYASGAPCAMCTGALFWAGVSKVIFAASQSSIAYHLGAPILPTGCAQVLEGASRKMEIIGNLLAAEAEAVLAEHAAQVG